jgi:DNA-binding NarL/FixJ family response regulator
MRCAFLADPICTERFALRLFLMGLNMDVAGEAADWPALLAQAPATRAELLLVDWGLISDGPVMALQELRYECPSAMFTVLIAHPDAEQQASLAAAGATFLCKDEPPEHLVESLRIAAGLLSIDC